ncbi:MAG TPA: PAS domain S-box protein, partial [Abditibacteriaceae bacterium]
MHQDDCQPSRDELLRENARLRERLAAIESSTGLRQGVAGGALQTHESESPSEIPAPPAAGSTTFDTGITTASPPWIDWRNAPRFRRLAESNSLGFFWVDGTDRVYDANALFLDIIGATADALQRGLFWGDFWVSPRGSGTAKDVVPDAAQFAQNLRRNLEENEVVTWSEHFLRDAGGRVFPVMLGAAREPDDSGNYFGFVLDLSAQEEIKRSLQESEQRYRSLFDYNPDAIFSIDRDGVFTSVNPASTLMSGYEAEELIGRSFVPVIAPESLQSSFEGYTRALSGETVTNELRILSKDGRLIDLATTSVPIIINGETTGVFG